MNEPHAPISQNEMDPSPPPASSGRNTLFTLASLLVLAGIVGITLWLYIQNKQVKTASTTLKQPQNENNQAIDLSPIPTGVVLGEENKDLVEKYGAICKRFTSIESALKEIEVACVLDLTDQSLNSLPEDIKDLTSLKQIILRGNRFTEFPAILLTLNELNSIDISNNMLKSLPAINNRNIRTIIIADNKFTKEEIEKLKKTYPQISFELP